jgi:tetratricopeptide (TPR) repeat protein
VFISTIASDVRDLPPFIGEPEGKVAQAGYRRQLDRADSAEVSGDTTRALGILRGSVTEFPDAADPEYALARLFDAAGRYDSAAAHYRAARDRDRLTFRAPSAMNGVIRQEAARSGATLVDALGALRAASPHGIVGKSLILEHVHPNIEGQFLIANAFYDKLRHSDVFPDTGHFVPEAVARRNLPVTVIDSMMGAFLVQRLTAGFPFKPRGTTAVVPSDTLTPRDTVQAIALAYFRRRISWLDAQESLRHFYGEEGRLQDVLHVDRVVALEVPFAATLLRAATTARLAGDLDLTTRLASTARERGGGAQALVLMAGVLDTRNDTAGARRLFDEAQQLAPGNSGVHTSVQAFNAIPQLRARARAHPGDAEVLGDLAAAYYSTGQYDRAADLGRRALKIDPEQKAALTVQRRIQALMTS